MPQASYPYALGRIKVMETRMLDVARMKKLAAAADMDEFLKLLQETGYGDGLLPSDGLEELAKSELGASRRLVWAITPEPEATSLFFLSVDAHNLRVFFKARSLGGLPPEDLIWEGGVFPPEVLARAVNEKSYVFLPEPLRIALDELEKALTHSQSPQLISTQVDGAIFKYVQSVLAAGANDYATDYFSLLADFTNVRSFIRARMLKWDMETFLTVLVACGSIPPDVFARAFALPDEQLALAFNRGRHGSLIVQGLEEYFSKNSVAALEKKLEALFTRFAVARRTDIDSLGPLAGYLAGKETEAKALRVVAYALRHGTQPELPELYM